MNALSSSIEASPLQGFGGTLKSGRILHLVLTVLAVLAAGALFAIYGTALPTTPFGAVRLEGPTFADSNGEYTVVVDSRSRRALILDKSGSITGMVNTLMTDSPIDAITDVCVEGESIYLLGVRFASGSDVIKSERVVKSDAKGNLFDIVYEKKDEDTTVPSIKALSNVSGGCAIAHEVYSSQGTGASSTDKRVETTGGKILGETGYGVTFEIVDGSGSGKKASIAANDVVVHDAAYSAGKTEHCAILSIRGVLEGGNEAYDHRLFEGHVLTSIDIDDAGVLYACDDETGGLYSLQPGSSELRELVAGDGFVSVHENKGVISLCDDKANEVGLYDAAGNLRTKFGEVKPGTRIVVLSVLVWASGLYLVCYLLYLAIRRLRRLVRDGDTRGLAPLLLSLAVVTAVAIAIGSFMSYSYGRTLETRENEINMCADYLEGTKESMSGPMERASNRDAIRGSLERLNKVADDLLNAAKPALMLVDSAGKNNIGMYCVVYGNDQKGPLYLYDSACEYVMGTSIRASEDAPILAAFKNLGDTSHDLQSGRTLRDVSQYRLVQIPTADGKGVAGVIEIGVKQRTLDSTIVGRLVRGAIALIAMMLVVYLSYTELRECGRCLLLYRERRKDQVAEATALLTRPYTFFVTMLTSVDSVMTVLIARELLEKAGAGNSSPLLAVPAVMLGVGMMIGHGLYGYFGSRVGLRKLATGGALVMLLFACLCGCTVLLGDFWLYCVAKLLMSVPFGMLYSLGYSLPRIARTDETRALAAGGVKRTDTSAAALGTVLGGYAAQVLGNVGVYALIALLCIPVIIMVYRLLPKGADPLEMLAQPDQRNGRILDFLRTPSALALALFIVLPATLAAGYTSFLFPLFSSDFGLEKADINNIVVLGQVFVFVCISGIEYMEGRYGRWRVSSLAIAALGVVFLLFSIKTTLVWSTAVIALVGLFGKSSDGWKAMWLASAGYAEVPTGRATGAMYATRSLALIVQPAIMGLLLGATDSFAVIVLGTICVICAVLFVLVTRRTPLAPGNSSQ